MMLTPWLTVSQPSRAEGWSDYPIIIWQDQTEARALGLRRLGITAARVFGNRDTPLTAAAVRLRMAPAIAAGLAVYVENIATDFYSAYHRFQPDHPVTWAFDHLRALAARDPADPRVFRRVPSLSDPAALAGIRERLQQHVRLFGAYRPLFYDLGDETGIADLAAAWDFDFSATSLRQMRAWLRRRYGSLAALNAQWGRDFARWDAVMPMTTDAAIRDGGDNLSAWADFKAWMDTEFANALRAGTQAVHAADPAARAGIEGAQVPGWGGYDYSKLAGAVDVMELYDAGNNVEIAQALNPGLITLTTLSVAERNPAAQAAWLWHALLLGNRGLIVWDEAGALVDDTGQPTPAGLAAGAVFAAFHDGVAAQLGVSAAVHDPVAILYSPASFRIAWLLARRSDPGRWTERGSEVEGADTPLRRSMRTAAEGLLHQGVQPRWTSADQLDRGALRHGVRVLLLAQAIALSDTAVAEIRHFHRQGGLVLAEGEPGWFDAHGRRRAKAPLQGIVQSIASWSAETTRLRQAGLHAFASIGRPDGTPVADIDVRVRRSGEVTLLGLQRDAPAPDGDAEDVVLTLRRPGRIYDLRRHTDLGWRARLVVRVGAAEPVVLAVAPARLPGLLLTSPASVPAGGDVAVRIGLAGASTAAHVLQAEALDPAGRLMSASTLVLRDGAASWKLRTHPGDPPGRWQLRVSDRLGETVARAALDVTASGVAPAPH